MKDNAKYVVYEHVTGQREIVCRTRYKDNAISIANTLNRDWETDEDCYYNYCLIEEFKEEVDIEQTILDFKRSKDEQSRVSIL